MTPVFSSLFCVLTKKWPAAQPPNLPSFSSPSLPSFFRSRLQRTRTRSCTPDTCNRTHHTIYTDILHTPDELFKILSDFNGATHQAKCKLEKTSYTNLLADMVLIRELTEPKLGHRHGENVSILGDPKA